MITLNQLQGKTYTELEAYFSEHDEELFDSYTSLHKELSVQSGAEIFPIKVAFAGWIFRNLDFLDNYSVEHTFISTYVVYACFSNLDVVDQILFYLKFQLETWKPMEEQKSDITKKYLTIRSAVVSNDTEIIWSPKKLDHHDLYTRILKASQAADITLELATLKSMLIQEFSVLAEYLPHVNNVETVDEILNVYSFFIGIKNDNIYYVIRMHANVGLDLSKKFDSNVDLLLEEFKLLIVDSYGDISTIPPQRMLPIFTYLSEKAKETKNDNLNNLIIFDAASNTFVWNEDLLAK